MIFLSDYLQPFTGAETFKGNVDRRSPNTFFIEVTVVLTSKRTAFLPNVFAALLLRYLSISSAGE